jgi:predicted nucleic acid-binding protein
MAIASPVFFDTSVLVAGTIDLGTDSVAPLRVLGAVADGRIGEAATSWHCCLEFLSVTTRLPPEYRLTPEDAVRIVRDDILPSWSVCDLPRKGRSDFLDVLARDRIVGGHIYDAQFAEVARHSGASVVVTENRRHFTSLVQHGVRVLTSGVFVVEAGLRSR